MLNANLEKKQEKYYRQLQQFKDELGEIFIHFIQDLHIKEIMLNPDGTIWIDDQKSGMQPTSLFFSYDQAYKLITTIADLRGHIVNSEHPILETELPLFDHRFSAIVPDVVNFPVFCIRKNIKKIFSLEEYLMQGLLEEKHIKLMRHAIQMRFSILIAGGPGTGKTTLANTLLSEMVNLGKESQRIVIIEDTKELICPTPNSLYLKTNSFASFNQLLNITLRMRPDKICLGECRGSETLVLLKAWNTGAEGGLATIHSNTATSALERLEELSSSESSVSVRSLIASSVKMIISLSFDMDVGRKIKEIILINGYSEGKYQIEKFL